MEGHRTIGVQLHDSLVRAAATAVSARSNVAALVAGGARQHFFETGLSFVVSDTSGVVVGHGDADSFFESTGVAAGNGIPLIPFDDLLSFFENFHGSVRIVCQRLVLALRHWSHGDAALGMSDLCSRFLDIQQPELYRIYSAGFRHLINHLLAADLEF